eukprot:1157812-Pelagomonas_calceolata.AAC.8
MQRRPGIKDEKRNAAVNGKAGSTNRTTIQQSLDVSTRKKNPCTENRKHAAHHDILAAPWHANGAPP